LTLLKILIGIIPGTIFVKLFINWQIKKQGNNLKLVKINLSIQQPTHYFLELMPLKDTAIISKIKFIHTDLFNLLRDLMEIITILQ
jgi:hypothetical protein